MIRVLLADDEPLTRAGVRAVLAAEPEFEVVAEAADGHEAAAAAPARMTLPGPSGPFPVGTTELHLVDHDRIDPWSAEPRELMISLTYPAWPSTRPVAHHLKPGVADFYDRNSGQAGIAPGMADFAGTRSHARIDAPRWATGMPVIIYSPGGGGSRFMGTALVEDLASRGYLVVSVDHTFTGPVQFPDRTEGLGRGVDNATVMRTRAADTSFVLDTLAARGVDLSTVGMFDHSMGGFTTAEAMIIDHRIDAGVNLDGTPTTGGRSGRTPPAGDETCTCPPPSTPASPTHSCWCRRSAAFRRAPWPR